MGAVTSKPNVDRLQLQQIVAGLTEGIVIIDPDRSIVWANDMALEIHGVEKFTDLGTDATQYRKRFVLTYRNNHALKAKQYPIERILEGQSFQDVTVQVTKPDDQEFFRVHQTRGLILTNSAGSSESMIQDVTDRFSAEERFERTFNANPAPALICRLSDLRYIKVNRGFLDMTGYDRDAVIDRSMYELDVLDKADNRDEAIQSLQEWCTITQREAVLRLPSGDDKYVIVAGQPIEIDGENCMLFTFIDLDARKKAELSLGQSEERFSKAFRLAPVPMMVCALPELRTIEVNTAFSLATGHAAEDMLGKSPSDMGLWDEPKRYRELQLKLDANVAIRDFEIPLRTREGEVIDCLLSAEPVVIQDQACVLCVVQDITERKRSEMDLIAAIEAVMKDTSWFSRTVMEKLAQVRHGGTGSRAHVALDDLTPRETEILTLICKGHSDEEMASLLKLSRNTVRNHIAALYGKIGVNRRSAAVVWGRERGLVSY
jgi:PAS domain S-box-containing protein